MEYDSIPSLQSKKRTRVRENENSNSLSHWEFAMAKPIFGVERLHKA